MSQSPDADIGWGVALRDDSEYGEGEHPSIEGVDIWKVIEPYEDVLELTFAGGDSVNYPVVFIKRTHISATWGHEKVDLGKLTHPTVSEQIVLYGFLRDAGFGGNYYPELLLVASYG